MLDVRDQQREKLGQCMRLTVQASASLADFQLYALAGANVWAPEGDPLTRSE